MRDYIMFVDEDINTVYANIDTVIENAGISYIEGDVKEAQRYKEGLDQVYREIGKSVLENRDVAEIIQSMLRHITEPEIQHFSRFDDDERECFWYKCASETEPELGDPVIDFNTGGCVEEVDYLTEEETKDMPTLGRSEAGNWFVVSRPKERKENAEECVFPF